MVTQNILVNLVNFLAPVIGIALVIFCLIKAFSIFKGNEGGSVKSLVIGVVLLLFIIGIMFAARNITSVGENMSETMNSALDNISSGAGEIIGGGAE